MTRKTFWLTLLFFPLMSQAQTGFKKEQLRYGRVRQAYEKKKSVVKAKLSAIGVRLSKVEVYLRAFKAERELEVWARNRGEGAFRLFKIYPFAGFSGKLGPKRKQGDYQIPEGLYHIDRFNPASRFHLSLGLNYPNAADRLLSDPKRPGGDIFIHGSFVTIGCIPITDDKIREVYLLCVEAKNAGQKRIPVHSFPFRMGAEKCASYAKDFSDRPDLLILWAQLCEAFEVCKDVPQWSVDESGAYRVVSRCP